MSEIEIRPAIPDDRAILVEFNYRLALETESMQLSRETLRAGVEAVLADQRKGRYFVACAERQVVGQLMHTWEWSDWRNGDIWWLQSVYVHPDFRRRGVFRKLYDYVQRLAEQDPHVAGIRLYVERENRRAQQTYSQLGMQQAGYQVMEQMFDRSLD